MHRAMTMMHCAMWMDGERCNQDKKETLLLPWTGRRCPPQPSPHFWLVVKAGATGVDPFVFIFFNFSFYFGV